MRFARDVKENGVEIASTVSPDQSADVVCHCSVKVLRILSSVLSLVSPPTLTRFFYLSLSFSPSFLVPKLHLGTRLLPKLSFSDAYAMRTR